MDNDNYINFGDMVSSRLGTPCQYASRYIHGRIEGWPKLSDGLRFKGEPINGWHSVMIHIDDVNEFVRRVREHIGFVNFGEFVALPLLQEQSQYASRYVDGFHGEYPNLGKGLLFIGDPRDYHELLIYKDDIEEFVCRVKKHWKDSGVIRPIE